MIENSKIRIAWIDTAKGILILFVILGHAINEELRTSFKLLEYIYAFIYRFHMPAFMLLSGMTMAISLKNKRNNDSYIKNCLKKDIKTLLVPYFSYGTVVYIVFKILDMIQVLKSMNYTVESFIEFVFGMIMSENKYCMHLWYIYTLFFMHLFVYFVDKNKNAKKYVLMMGICSVLTKFVLGTDNLKLINNICSQFIFFACGYAGYDIFLYNLKEKLCWIVGVVSAFSINIYLLYGVKSSFKIIRIAESLILTFFQFGMILGIIALAVLIDRKSEFFMKIGKESFYIYLFQQPFTTFCSMVLLNIVNPCSNVGAVCVVATCFFVSLITSVLVKMCWLNIISIFFRGEKQ